METFEDHYASMVDTITRCMPGANLELIERAVHYADAKHEYQKRKDGSPYIIHPLAVAEIVAEMGLDTDAVLGAILHDCIEDTDASHDDIAKLFSPTVAELVEGVTKLTRTDFTSQEEKQMENLRKMFMAMSKDIRVVLIKIADRLHNMRTMQYQSPKKQVIKCRETMDIYAPLAHRLGMQKLKWELEDLSLRYLYPEDYAKLTEFLSSRKDQDEAFMNTIQFTIKEKLSEYGIHNTTYGRIKHIYSIYRKMQAQNKTLDELYDIYAFRVIVDSEIDCYNVLGHIHTLFTPVPGRFKDYISTKKPNGYKSLHTTVIGKKGIPFEVQIRTWEMHEIAEYGVAAHWKYKAKAGDGSEKDFEWVRRLLEGQQDIEADDYLESLKIDMFNDQVFVFTPKGKALGLPAGSCPIDFAYAIHSGVGNSMVAAKVNNRLVNIDTPLKNGDIVEILTSKASRGPSRNWLIICKSNQARTKIKQWFKKEKREENIEHGKAAFEAEMKRVNLPISVFTDPQFTDPLLEKLPYTCWDDFYAAIGYGGLTAAKAVSRIQEDVKKFLKGPVIPAPDQINPQLKINPDSEEVRRNRHAINGVIVDDLDSCMIKFSKCCTPVPGDDIVGFITRGYGVSVHRTDCPNAAVRSDPRQAARWVHCRWATDDNQPFNTTLELECHNRDGLVMDVSTTLFDARVRMKGFNALELENDRCIITVSFEVRNVNELTRVRNRLLSIKDVLAARRGQN
ncbi:MAG: bifunctional (p)ppGpp synthetase/guanosine-3',5'-bis(diphosphate) 3'-pyrophosphohydrolase [Oscillospiraceae bacterium]|nr:bifunctional (p)ppGpp synthetase/guanosine-3',5'-bis(diphosphate) 3'-pyrophosphohydrolase [Oscillospiraceae bacterium]